jgi:phosphoribosylaminoimidazole-succinocarboxamide synthase
MNSACWPRSPYGVANVFDLGDTLLFVATDRISAFDVILPDPIPKKSPVLNQLSAFWFKHFETIDNHFVTADSEKFPEELKKFRDQLASRSMIVKKTTPLPVECVVRGYLAGSGWKEYQESQNVCGIKLPSGLQLASQLPEPIFAGNKSGSWTRHQHRLERMLPHPW